MRDYWDESALPEAKSVEYSPAVQRAILVDGLLDVPAALRDALDGSGGALFFQFKDPLTDGDMEAADFLVTLLSQVLSGGMLEGGGYYFRASWYPGEQDSYILGLLLETHAPEEEPAGVGADSPAGQEIIRAIAAAFDVDPAALGGAPQAPDEPPAIVTRSQGRDAP